VSICEKCSDDEEEYRKRENLIKRVSVKRRKTYISKIKVFTPKRKIAHLNRAMKVSPTVKEKKLFSWP
jgi:hypothetical protein